VSEVDRPFHDEPAAGQAVESSEAAGHATGAPVSGAQTEVQAASRASASGKESLSVWTVSAQSLLMTIVIAVFVITFVVQAFQIPSESMERTLLVGDYLLVDKLHYGSPGVFGSLMPYEPVRHGDIVVFRYPVRPNEHFVKRVIGLPGDRIHLENKRVYVNDQPLTEPYVHLRRGSYEEFRDNFPANPAPYTDVTAGWLRQMRTLVRGGELVIPANSYFVLGDNRDNSLDSRYWGFVPRENVIGRPLLIYWSARAAGGADSSSPQNADAEAAPQNGKLFSLRPVFERWLGIRWRRIFRLVE
jgi:signal peptidase I